MTLAWTPKGNHTLIAMSPHYTRRLPVCTYIADNPYFYTDDDQIKATD